MIHAKKEIKLNGRIRRGTYTDDEKDGMSAILEVRTNKKGEESCHLVVGYNLDFMVPHKVDTLRYRTLHNALMVNRTVKEAVDAAMKAVYPIG